MRLVKRIIISIFLIAILVYFMGGYIAKRILKFGLEYVEPVLTEHGILVKQFDYGNVRLHSLNSFTIRDVDIRFDLEQEIFGKKSFNAQFFSESIVVRLTQLNDPLIRFSLRNFNLYIQSNESNPDRPFGKFENAYWYSNIPIRLYDLKESGKIVVNKLMTLFQENSIPDNIEFRADALLNMDTQTIRVRMFTERIDGRSFLRFDENDILNASREVPDMELSEKEADLISQSPARALYILKITRDARRLSKQEKSKDEDFPDDAFKHIYWSYHLTKKFGPALAKEITDAHETLPTNTPQQRQMDFHNNGIGRQLASKDFDLVELKKIVLNNPDIIRSPEEIR